jgi:phosphoadenosine phosphosulfate reductase
MLIVSRRHAGADLELWRELERADQVVGEKILRSGRLAESHRAVFEFATEGPCYAGISWGKDSVVLACLLWHAARAVPLVHLRPTNHNPDCDAVRDAYFRAYPGQSYEEVAVDYGDLHRRSLPDCVLDRETDERWGAAIRETERRFAGRHILGIRSAESFGRMIRTMRWGLSTPRSCAPIARWKTADIFGFLAAARLPVHPAYAMLGGGRWPRERLRVAEIGDTHGKGSGRREWETEYYGDVLRRLEARARGSPQPPADPRFGPVIPAVQPHRPR